jgi:hypothetical protein
MNRLIDSALLDWKSTPRRRVLLVRGARQVGKTFAVRELGKSFENYVEINFERDIEVTSFFEGSIDPEAICRKLSIFARKPLIPGRSLLFFDEIQAFPPALHALRFFHESIPDLHVVSAGSLLEFALSEIPSQGVGRLTSLHMHPLCFPEFLMALGEKRLGEAIGKAAKSGMPLDEPFHRRGLDLARLHMIIGGMPAVVAEYAASHDATVCQKILEDLLQFLRDDFGKYRTRVAGAKLDDTLMSVAHQAGGKFKYTIAAGESPIAGHKEALALLVKAGLVHRACHTAARGLPLGAQKDDKKFKVFPLDAGLYQRMLNLDLSSHIIKDPARLVNEGPLAEVYAGIELVAGMPAHLKAEIYYWHREVPGSHAEVDYVIAHRGSVTPLEVKSSGKGAMKSMHVFLGEGRAPRGIRLSQENFGKIADIDIAPFYAGSWITGADTMQKFLSTDESG